MALLILDLEKDISRRSVALLCSFDVCVVRYDMIHLEVKGSIPEMIPLASCKIAELCSESSSQQPSPPSKGYMIYYYLASLMMAEPRSGPSVVGDGGASRL